MRSRVPIDVHFDTPTNLRLSFRFPLNLQQSRLRFSQSLPAQPFQLVGAIKHVEEDASIMRCSTKKASANVESDHSDKFEACGLTHTHSFHKAFVEGMRDQLCQVFLCWTCLRVPGGPR